MKYEVRTTRFHGGDTISRHRTLSGASRALAKAQRDHGDCTCGGPGITCADAPEAFNDGSGHYGDVSAGPCDDPTCKICQAEEEQG